MKASKEQLYLFFKEIWKKRSHICEVTGKKLYDPVKSYYFHHILAKSKYPELALKEDNIILLHGDVHASVELDAYKYEIINERRKELIKKYEL